MRWSVKKKVLVSCCVGWGLSILGAGLIPLLNFVIRKMVEQNVVISSNNDLVYNIWKDYPIPIYMQFYIFNVTNPEGVLQGKKPHLKQTGPYTYSERRFKFNITFNLNGTVTYRQKRVFQFLRDKSVGNESDIFTSPNPVYWTLISSLKMESGEVRKVVKDILDLLDEHVFISRSVKELLWGYQDALLTASQKIDPEWFYTDIIGYFINKNDTDDGIYTIYTGEKDISLLGVIDKYNGSSVLPFWTTYYANMINGTDGSLSPPYIDKSRTMYSFASDVCRSVAGVYSEDSLTPQGIDVWRFTAPLNYLQNASINPDNLGFCTPQNNCLGQGLINVSNCQLVDFFHIPAVISFPHFYLADKKYLDAVVGLNPNEAEHQTIVDVEPYTGLVLQAAKRLQVNLHLQPIANITETEHITEVFLPIFWLNEIKTLPLRHAIWLPWKPSWSSYDCSISMDGHPDLAFQQKTCCAVFFILSSAVIDDENADKMISMLFTPLKIIWVLEITLISVGLLVALVSAMYCAFNRHLVLRPQPVDS